MRQAEQRRQDEFEWLAKGREKYELSAGLSTMQQPASTTSGPMG